MVCSQKNKNITGRGPSATGQHKNAKSFNSAADENSNPVGSPPASTPSKPCPKPRPLAKKAANSTNAIIPEAKNGEATAARALITLQNGNCGNSPPINHYFHAAAGLPKGTNLDPSSGEEDYEEDEEDEEDELADDLEEEVDEMHNSDDSGEWIYTVDFANSLKIIILDLLLSTGLPIQPKFPEFKVLFVVPYCNASRNVDGITSKTSFNGVLRRLSERMEVGLTHLSGIGYIPSYIAKTLKPRPLLLEDNASWYKLHQENIVLP